MRGAGERQVEWPEVRAVRIGQGQGQAGRSMIQFQILDGHGIQDPGPRRDDDMMDSGSCPGRDPSWRIQVCCTPMGESARRGRGGGFIRVQLGVGHQCSARGRGCGHQGSARGRGEGVHQGSAREGAGCSEDPPVVPLVVFSLVAAHHHLK